MVLEITYNYGRGHIRVDLNHYYVGNKFKQADVRKLMKLVDRWCTQKERDELIGYLKRMYFMYQNNEKCIKKCKKLVLSLKILGAK